MTYRWLVLDYWNFHFPYIPPPNLFFLVLYTHCALKTTLVLLIYLEHALECLSFHMLPKIRKKNSYFFHFFSRLFLLFLFLQTSPLFFFFDLFETSSLFKNHCRSNPKFFFLVSGFFIDERSLVNLEIGWCLWYGGN